jgi:hypothetical protein
LDIFFTLLLSVDLLPLEETRGSILTPKDAKIKALASQADIAAGSVPNSAVENAELVSNQQLTPRLLSRQQAAEYCCLSPSAFSSWVRSRKLPPSLPGTTRWDLKAIDFALDAMSGLNSQEELSALDEWRAKRARRSERDS